MAFSVAGIPSGAEAPHTFLHFYGTAEAMPLQNTLLRGISAAGLKPLSYAFGMRHKLQPANLSLNHG